ncbi:MAG: matrixin family metalloprotease [Actinomycetes bacterium]
MEQDFFRPPPAGSWPPPGAAPAVVPVGRPPSRRRGTGRSVLAGAGAAVAVLVVGLALLPRTQGDPLPELRQVQAPASAVEGWAPAWADETGRPARWDPCTPIPYVVNPTWMPQRGREDLAEALRRISVVSGLEFVDGGDTDELPSTTRPAYQPERYGERWAPMLVAWVPAGTTDIGIGSGVQGLAASTAVPTTQGGVIVTAQVAFDADNRLASGFGPGATEGEVMLHELAHAVGLGHVDDPTQVMYFRTTNSESEFGAGDRAGLTALGRASGCLRSPAPRPAEDG